MPKLRLTEYQKKLIEDNYQLIKENLNKYAAKIGITNKHIRRLNVENALGYAVEAALKYNPEKYPEKSFATYASFICFFRMVDAYRSHSRYSQVGKVKNEIIKKLEEDSIRHLGYVDEEFIKKSASFLNKELKQFQQKRLCKKHFSEKTLVSNKDFDVLDSLDRISVIMPKCDKFFEGDSKLSQIRRSVIKEYLLPKIQNKEHKNLNQIAKEYDISNGRLSQILKDDTMRDFITSIYKDVDRNGKPVLR